MNRIKDKVIAPIRWAVGDLDRGWRRLSATQPVTAVLCYHRVTTDQPSEFSEIEAGVPAAVFEQQMQFAAKRFRPIRAADAVSDDEPGFRFAVTFDDGTKDNIDVAAPILEKLGIPATFYAVSDFVGTDRRFWWEEFATLLRVSSPTAPVDLMGAVESVSPLADHFPKTPFALSTHAEKMSAHNIVSAALRSIPHAKIDAALDVIASELGRPRSREGRDFPLMTWDELRELVARGFDIGSHSATHCNMGNVSAEDAVSEIGDATRRIEAEIQRPVESFAYPYGGLSHLSQTAEDILRTQTDVKVAYSTGPGLVAQGQNSLSLPRTGFTRSSPFVWSYNLERSIKETPELAAA